MKYLKLALSVFSLAVLFSMSVSCSRGGGSDDVFPPYVGNTVGDYSVKITGSTGVQIGSVVVVIDGATHVLAPRNGNVYTSPTYKGSNFAASVSATGANQSSTLKVELIKNGTVVKTSTAQGKYLAASITD